MQGSCRLGKLSFRMVLLCWLTLPTAWGYSYAGAGEELLIQARQALLQALQPYQPQRAQQALAQLQEPVQFLENYSGPGLWHGLQQSTHHADPLAVRAQLDRIFHWDIQRRLQEARVYLHQHQKAKNLLVRCQQMLQLMLPGLSAEQSQQAEQALQHALLALGQPGVFGVGEVAADAEKLNRAIDAYLAAIPW